MTRYKRLDGVYAIATVVDDIIDRIMEPRQNVNPTVAGGVLAATSANGRSGIGFRLCPGKSIKNISLHDLMWEFFRQHKLK